MARTPCLVVLSVVAALGAACVDGDAPSSSSGGAAASSVSGTGVGSTSSGSVVCADFLPPASLDVAFCSPELQFSALIGDEDGRLYWEAIDASGSTAQPFVGWFDPISGMHDEVPQPISTGYIGVDEAFVYWMAGGSFGDPEVIHRAPKGHPVGAEQFGPDWFELRLVAEDGVYAWDRSVFGTTALSRLSKTDGSVTEIVRLSGDGYSADPDFPSVLPSVGATYFTFDKGGKWHDGPLSLQRIDGGAVEPVEIATSACGDQNEADGALTQDAEFVYWVQSCCTVRRISKVDGSDTVLTVGGKGEKCRASILDGDTLYYARSGRVFSLATAGGALVDHGPTTNGPTGIVATPASVYFPLLSVIGRFSK